MNVFGRDGYRIYAAVEQDGTIKQLKGKIKKSVFCKIFRLGLSCNLL